MTTKKNSGFCIIPLSEFNNYYTFFQSQEEKERNKTYHLLWIKSPTQRIFYGVQNKTIRSESVLFADAQTIKYVNVSDTKGKMIIFNESFFLTPENKQILKLCFLCNKQESVCLVELNDKNLMDCLELLEREYAMPFDQFRHPILLNLLISFLILSENMYIYSAGSLLYNSVLNDVFRFQDLVDVYFKEEKNVSFYADKMGISERQLAKNLKNILNTTPKNLIKNRTILEATRLLLFTGLSLTDIAHELGFQEVSYFMKYFKKHTGLSPSNFKKKYLINYP